MEFCDAWGANLIVITLDTHRLPYRLTERYGSSVRARTFWFRSSAELEHTRALRNAESIIELIRDAEPQHRSAPFLRR